MKNLFHSASVASEKAKFIFQKASTEGMSNKEQEILKTEANPISAEDASAVEGISFETSVKNIKSPEEIIALKEIQTRMANNLYEEYKSRTGEKSNDAIAKLVVQASNPSLSNEERGAFLDELFDMVNVNLEINGKATLSRAEVESKARGKTNEQTNLKELQQKRVQEKADAERKYNESVSIDIDDFDWANQTVDINGITFKLLDQGNGEFKLANPSSDWPKDRNINQNSIYVKMGSTIVKKTR